MPNKEKNWLQEQIDNAERNVYILGLQEKFYQQKYAEGQNKEQYAQALAQTVGQKRNQEDWLKFLKKQ
jgi:hypothetical protein